MIRRLLLLVLLVTAGVALATTFPVNTNPCGDPLGNCYLAPSPVFSGLLGTSAPEGVWFAVNNLSAGRIGYFEGGRLASVTKMAVRLALHPSLPDYPAAERRSRARGIEIGAGPDQGERSGVQDGEPSQDETRWLEEQLGEGRSETGA